ncbi:MAG: hypothetical protein RMM58_15895 [Chloroflexota bacterium]|nr:hypothetical protein [Chloroflexota bacterium]
MSTGEIWSDVPSVPGVLVGSQGRVMIAPYRSPMPNDGERLWSHADVWCLEQG